MPYLDRGPSRNSGATTNASSGAVDLGRSGPHSNLPFSQWITGIAPSVLRPSTESTLGGVNQGGFERSLNLNIGLKRGRLREAHPNLRGGDPVPFRVYFMFNPTEISVAYGFNESLIPSAFAEGDDLSVDLMTNGSSIGFALLFDRTYEVWKGEPAVVEGRKGPGQVGCLWDIMALERLMGIFHDGSGTPSGPPTMGQIVASFGAEGGRSLEFRGFLSSVSVTYATFSADMTPTRARVDVQMSQSFLATQATVAAFTATTTTPGTTPGSSTKVPVLPSQPSNSRT